MAVTFNIGDRVVCPNHPYLGEMTIEFISQPQKKIEFIASADKYPGTSVQGTATIFALAKTEATQLSLWEGI